MTFKYQDVMDAYSNFIYKKVSHEAEITVEEYIQKTSRSKAYAEWMISDFNITEKMMAEENLELLFSSISYEQESGEEYTDAYLELQSKSVDSTICQVLLNGTHKFTTIALKRKES